MYHKERCYHLDTLKERNGVYMKKQNFLVSAFCGILIVGGLTGCSMAVTQSDTSAIGANSPQESDVTASNLSVAAYDGTENADVPYEEQFKPYEQFGMTYNASKGELEYNGKSVRWFEDYYTIPDGGGQAGTDFFNENGVVDVYAVRDLNSFIRSDDGSFDSSGKLIGLKEFSEEEFAARNIEAIKNPPLNVAVDGEPTSAKEFEEMAKEYAAFGVTYEAKENRWYLGDEKVRFCRDVLTSNGESMTGGKFKGSMRTFESTDGTIDIYTVRDFANLNDAGYGTLTGIEKYSQKEFDEHTRSSQEVQSSSGTCTVTQE